MLIQENNYPLMPQNQLKQEGHYIGTLMIVLLVAMEITFSAVIIMMLLFGLIDASAVTDTYCGMNNTTYLLVYAAVYGFVFLTPTVVVSLCFKKHPFPLMPRERLNATDGFLSIIGTVGFCILTSTCVSMLMSYLADLGVPMPELPSMLENTPQSYVLNLLVVAVLPSLLEELLFRGCILRVLRAYGDWFAILVSAVLFGLMHGNIVQIPFALIIGVALGWLYVATENIWIPIAVHFANNAISISMEYAMMQLSETGQNVFAVIVYGLLILIGVIAFVILSIRKSELFNRLSGYTLLSRTGRVKALLSSPVLLVALVAFVIKLIVGMF